MIGTFEIKFSIWQSGGIIRNSLGNWCMGFSGYCEVTTILNAELQLIYYGIKLALSARYTNIMFMCESDSKVVV